KKGNIVNLGTINANDILLIGNKVEIGVGGKIRGQDGSKNAKEAHLVGNYVYVNVGKEGNENTIKVEKNGLKGTAIKEGYLQRDMTSFAEDDYEFGDFGTIFKASYDGKNSVDFTKAVTIGGWYNDNNTLNDKKNANEWKLFADGWNSNDLTEDIFKDGLTTIRLISDIDFTGFSPIDPVGANKYAFSGVFDGGGYTLKNIKIKAQDSSTGWNTGLFGKVEGKDGQKAKIYNLNVDGLSFSGVTNSGGGFVAIAKDAEFNNIHLSNFGDLYFYDSKTSNDSFLYGGGFIGWTQSGTSFKNITMKNFGDIVLKPKGSYSSQVDMYLGGFAGFVEGVNNKEQIIFNNILMENFDSIKAMGSESGANIYAGGFAGYIKNNSNFSSITLNEIGNSRNNYDLNNKGPAGMGIYAGYDLDNPQSQTFFKNTAAGGFAGVISGQNVVFNKISLNDIGDIEATRGYISTVLGDKIFAAAGGFVGLMGDKWNDTIYADFSDIYLNFKDNLIYAEKGKLNSNTFEWNYAGGFVGGSIGNVGNTFKINNVDLRFDKNVKIDVWQRNEGSIWNRGIFAGWYMDNTNFHNSISNMRVFYRKNDTGGLGVGYSPRDYFDFLKGGIFDVTTENSLNSSGNRVLYYYDKRVSDMEVNNKIKSRFGNIDEHGNVIFYASNKPVGPDIPDLTPPSIEKNDFDPAMLQHILDDIMNGHYAYDTKT
ncbi:hypothetical protein L8T90_07760, partial [Campylobacter sp. RKI_CA19_01121]|nr:hypothetical protein [Campylobacter sp. RKI_CA19_01121]